MTELMFNFFKKNQHKNIREKNLHSLMIFLFTDYQGLFNIKKNLHMRA